MENDAESESHGKDSRGPGILNGQFPHILVFNLLIYYAVLVYGLGRVLFSFIVHITENSLSLAWSFIMQEQQGFDHYTDRQHLEPTDKLPKYVAHIADMKMLINNEVPHEFASNTERLAKFICVQEKAFFFPSIIKHVYVERTKLSILLSC